MPYPPPDWVKDAVFYLIFPDRFAGSARVEKPANLEPWLSPPTSYGFKGGDLYGILEKLDYLQDLGVTALLLNPIFMSAANHRYHTIDYYRVDHLLGGNTALKALIDELHRRGMKIILDGVFNHTGRGFPQFVHTLENGASSLYTDWFHFNKDWLARGRQIDAYPVHYRVLEPGDGTRCLQTYGYKGWWDLPPLPKLNTENPAVRRFLMDVARHWIEFGVDGWRLDVPSEINDDAFWQEFRELVKRANPEAYIVGEIWEDATRWLHGDQFDAVMNYPLTKALLGFIPGKSLNTRVIHSCAGYRSIKPMKEKEFDAAILKLLSMYPEQVNLVQLNLLGSHDTPRFLSCAGGDIKALSLAVLFIFTFPGAPCIYYGDEIGLQGGADPECRASFPWEEFRWNHEIRSIFRQAIRLRKDQPALRRGNFEEIAAGEDVFAFARHYGKESIYVFMNTSSERHSVSLRLTIRGTVVLKDLLSDTSVTLTDGIVQNLVLEPRSSLVMKGQQE